MLRMLYNNNMLLECALPGFERKSALRHIGKAGRFVKDWLRIVNRLSWLTQAGVSIAAPLLLCIGGGVWAHRALGLGAWIIPVGVVLGLGASVCSLFTFLKVVAKENAKKNDAPRTSFNR